MKLNIKKVIFLSEILIFTYSILCNKALAMEITTGESIFITQKYGINTIVEGEQLQLLVDGTESLSNRIKNTNVIWKSSDETIAKVDENGIVTAVSAGKVIIKANYADRYESMYEINVEKNTKNDVDDSNLERPIKIIDDEYDYLND